jgi:hypothetical protein
MQNAVLIAPSQSMQPIVNRNPTLRAFAIHPLVGWPGLLPIADPVSRYVPRP